ncbi:hypothetical protein GGR92_004858 [Spirosoma lacussanchae]
MLYKGVQARIPLKQKQDEQPVNPVGHRFMADE